MTTPWRYAFEKWLTSGGGEGGGSGGEGGEGGGDGRTRSPLACGPQPTIVSAGGGRCATTARPATGMIECLYE